MITSAVAEHLDLRPRLAEPDFAVALGAAIRAHQLAGDSSRAGLARAGVMLAAIADKPSVSVVPSSFGILLEDSHDPSGTAVVVAHLVHRNEPLPASRTATFCTIVEDRVRVQVFEQAGAVPSDRVEHHRRVLDGELTGLPALPAGARIDITLSLFTDGLLSVAAREPERAPRFDLSPI